MQNNGLDERIGKWGYTLNCDKVASILQNILEIIGKSYFITARARFRTWELSRVKWV